MGFIRVRNPSGPACRPSTASYLGRAMENLYWAEAIVGQMYALATDKSGLPPPTIAPKMSLINDSFETAFVL
jgi:hypothetical protein